jgi:hypothetical protein
LAQESLGAHPLLGQAQIGTQARDGSVVGEFVAPVISLGAVGKALDDERGVCNGIAAVIQKLPITANRHHVRIGTRIGGLDPDLHVAGVDIAGAALEMIPQLARQVCADQVVGVRTAFDGENLAVASLGKA